MLISTYLFINTNLFRKMAEIKQKFYEKLENFELDNREQWEAVKYSLNVVAQKAV